MLVSNPGLQPGRVERFYSWEAQERQRLWAVEGWCPRHSPFRAQLCWGRVATQSREPQKEGTGDPALKATLAGDEPKEMSP